MAAALTLPDLRAQVGVVCARKEPQGWGRSAQWAWPAGRSASVDSEQESDPVRGDGWSRASRGKGDLWGGRNALSIWAGGVRGNQYFR